MPPHSLMSQLYHISYVQIKCMYSVRHIIFSNSSNGSVPMTLYQTSMQTAIEEGFQCCKLQYWKVFKHMKRNRRARCRPHNCRAATPSLLAKAPSVTNVPCQCVTYVSCLYTVFPLGEPKPPVGGTQTPCWGTRPVPSGDNARPVGADSLPLGQAPPQPTTAAPLLHHSNLTRLANTP